jgi:hypothetical protein
MAGVFYVGNDDIGSVEIDPCPQTYVHRYQPRVRVWSGGGSLGSAAKGMKPFAFLKKRIGVGGRIGSILSPDDGLFCRDSVTSFAKVRTAVNPYAGGVQGPFVVGCTRHIGIRRRRKPGTKNTFLAISGDPFRTEIQLGWLKGVEQKPIDLEASASRAKLF